MPEAANYYEGKAVDLARLRLLADMISKLSTSFMVYEKAGLVSMVVYEAGIFEVQSHIYHYAEWRVISDRFNANPYVSAHYNVDGGRLILYCVTPDTKVREAFNAETL